MRISFRKRVPNSDASINEKPDQEEEIKREKEKAMFKFLFN
jgi:hypothetical protein